MFRSGSSFRCVCGRCNSSGCRGHGRRALFYISVLWITLWQSYTRIRTKIEPSGSECCLLFCAGPVWYKWNCTGNPPAKSRINKLYGDWQRHGLHYRTRIFGFVSGSRHQCPTLFLCCLSVQVNTHQCFVYCTEHQDGEHLLDLTSMKTVVVLIVPAEVDDVLFLL